MQKSLKISTKYGVLQLVEAKHLSKKELKEVNKKLTDFGAVDYLNQLGWRLVAVLTPETGVVEIWMVIDVEEEVDVSGCWERGELPT